MLSHRNLLASVTQIRQFLLQGHEPGRDKAVAILPIFHIYGMNGVMNLGVHMAATLVLLPRFEIKDLVDAIKDEKPTFFLGVPALYIAVLNHAGIDRIDMTSIKVCFSGGAPLPVEVIEQFEGRTGARIAEAYGMTEASSVTHVNPRDGKRKFGSVGLPIVGTDAKIVDVDDSKVELPPNQPGELLVRGPQIMMGYWNRQDETSEALVDGWLHTGDIAVVDDEGYFTIVDRKKDLILSGGFNVYPREVEEILYQHPKVELAAVIGLPNAVRGERIAAYIKLKSGEKATSGEIRRYCKEHLADYKVPRSIVFRDDLPVSIAGKVMRRILREEELAKNKNGMSDKQED
jgi:long-chain acyl-CoA synthetase